MARAYAASWPAWQNPSAGDGTRVRALREMMDVVFQWIIPIAMAAVLASLGFGIYALFRGGDFGRSWSNRMMRVRVVTQFIAVLVLIGALWWKQTYG
jgi:hypothetical protein